MVGKEINLTSDDIIIKSTNFSVSKNGKITASSGTIGGFTLTSSCFSSSISGIYNYNGFDVRNIAASIVEVIGTTNSTSNIFDVNDDGKISLNDFAKALLISRGNETSTKTISGTFKINSKDPKNFISISSGGYMVASMGVGGIHASLISALDIVCSSLTSETFSGVAIKGSDGTITAKNFNNSSLESLKKNIEELGDTIDIIANSKVYKFNYKTEDDNDKKHVGFVIGENYNTPSEIIDDGGKGINLYTMASIEWKALQKCIIMLKDLEKRISELEEK